MMKRLAPILLLGALAGAGAGCASAPAKFYALSPAAEAGGARANYSVAVGPVSIPAMVDRPQMVVIKGPNQVGVDELNRWASPLGNDIARVVAQNLVKLLGTPLVTVFPQATSAGALYRVWVDVATFESAPGKGATLDAVWRVRGATDDAVRAGRVTQTEPADDGSYAALVSSHSRALARLSADVADAIRAVEAGRR